MTRWDLEIFYGINRWPEWFSLFFQFMSTGLDNRTVKVGLALLLIGLAVWRKDFRVGIFKGILSFPIANEITDVLKATFPDPRPFQVLPDAILRVGDSPSMGTASAHSANTAAIATAIICSTGWRGLPFALLSFFTGLSRVYNGAHFPGQVLLGWFVGIVTGLSVHCLWNLVDRILRKNHEQVA
jgi:undecaprenyl-diphosphatase